MNESQKQFRRDLADATHSQLRAQCQVKDADFAGAPTPLLYAELIHSLSSVRQCLAQLVAHQCVRAPASDEEREEVSRLADLIVWQLALLAKLADKVHEWGKKQ